MQLCALLCSLLLGDRLGRLRLSGHTLPTSVPIAENTRRDFESLYFTKETLDCKDLGMQVFCL
jgi:hypothetical protein